MIFSYSLLLEIELFFNSNNDELAKRRVYEVFGV